MKEYDDKKVLCVWGIVWGTYFVLIVMYCSATALILILQYKYGVISEDSSLRNNTDYLTYFYFQQYFQHIKDFFYT